MSACGAFINSIMSEEKVLVDGMAVVVVVVVVVVGIVVVLSVVVLVVVVVGVNVVRRVDRVVAVLDAVRFGSAKVVVDGAVDRFVQVVEVEVGVVTMSAIDLVVVLITRPRAATVVLVVVAGPMVVDLEAAVRGASRNCAISRGSVPNIAPALRIECCLMLSANFSILDIRLFCKLLVYLGTRRAFPR